MTGSLYAMSCLSLTLFVLFILAARIADLRISLYQVGRNMPGLKSWNLETVYSRREIVRFRLHMLITDDRIGVDVPLVIEQSLQGPNAEFSFLVPLLHGGKIDRERVMKSLPWRFIAEDLKGHLELVDSPFVRVRLPERVRRGTRLHVLIEVLGNLRKADSPDPRLLADDVKRDRYMMDLFPPEDLAGFHRSGRLYYASFLAIACGLMVCGLSGLLFALLKYPRFLFT